jgi:hypothetical protein
LGYLAVFGAILAVEVFIGVFVRDRFIRPYVGDMLVTVLLCCLSRVVFPRLNPALPVFLFAAGVELIQLAGLPELLGLEGTLAGIILGSTFDMKDILCYALGCAAFACGEWLIKKRIK